MADLSGALAHGPVNLPIHDQSAADAGANRHVKKRRMADAGAVQSFPEAGDIGIVAQGGGEADDLR